jgi:aminocarboxymuconate-semialdehyde decarboxylase
MHSPIDERTLEPGRDNRYGPSAARPVGRVHPRIDSFTCDIHAHVFIKAAHELAGHLVTLDQIPLAKFAGQESWAINATQERARFTAFGDPKDRIAVLDAQGIDAQLVSVNQIQCYYALPIDTALAASRLVNDGIAEFCGYAPDRLYGLGNVPLQDPAAAIGELRRCMRDLRFRGVQILTEVNDKELSDPGLEPFWKEAAALGAVVMIHPFGFTHAHRFGQYYFSNVIGNPLATSVALHHAIFSGVLERHPTLKIYAVHGGGFLPAYSGRIDHAWGARRDAHGSLPKPPTHYLRQIYLDTTVFTPHQLEYLVRQYGVDHVMMGTDYAADMAEYQPVEHVLSVPSFTREEQAALAGGTAAKVFDLPPVIRAPR